MIISSWPRLVIGTLVLMICSAIGMFAWSIETCSGDTADSLWLGAITLAGNLLAWWLLGHRVPSKLVLFVAALPVLAALSYTMSTIHLAVGYLGHGTGACAIIKAGGDFGKDGREPIFIVLWTLACASFWTGLAPIVWRAIRVHGGISGSD